MNKDELNNLLDTIYELEGLVHLAITRDDEPFKLPDLIARKGREICRLAEEVAAKPVKKSVPAPEPAIVYEPEPAPAPKPAPIPEPKPAPTVTPTPAVTPKPMAKPAHATPIGNSQPRGKLVFSINDRYKFKRELFGGSDTAFNATLSLVASMESYDEAEEYFIDELQWDQSRIEVIEFLDILKNYFN